MKREFPRVEGMVGGDIIYDCWFEKVRDAGIIASRYTRIQQDHQS
jgi:hypothetical protein